MSKLDNASRKMQFLQPAQLSFVLSFFLSFGGKFVIFFGHFGAIVSKKNGNISKICRKMKEN